MRRAKRRIFSGVVCEQIVFSIPDRLKNLDKAEPRPRFKNEAEREAHKIAISRRKHNELFNENFSPTSLYSTLTLDNEHEVHTFDEADHIADLYVRRLKYDYPDAVIFVYMGRGKSTARIHLHMVSEGVPKDAILKKWGLGPITTTPPTPGRSPRSKSYMTSPPWIFRRMRRRTFPPGLSLRRSTRRKSRLWSKPSGGNAL